MNIKALNISKSRLYPIVVLDRMLSHRARHIIHGAIDAILGVLIILILLLSLSRVVPFIGATSMALAISYIPKAIGLALIFLSILLSIYLLEMFFRFSYFREGAVGWRMRGYGHESDIISFNALKILYAAWDGDVTKSFLRSPAGKKIMFRSGIPDDKQKEFLSKRSGALFDAGLPIQGEAIFGLESLAKFILSSDNEFRDFLFQNGVRESDLLGAASWAFHQEEAQKAHERWWTRARLSQIRGIGKDWAYGEAFTLKRYGREVLEDYNIHANALSIKDEREVRELERVLSRGSEANALLVGEKGAGTLDIIFDFAKKVSGGSIMPQLEHKKVFMLNTNSMIASVRGKEEFENLVLSIFTEAVRSGNLIIVLPDLPSFVASAKMLGSDVVSLIDPYLASPKIQMIAVSDIDGFHNTLEQNAALMARFEKVSVSDPSDEEMITILEHVAEDLESRDPIVFTYSAIEEALKSSENYLPDGVLPDKAIDLLVEVVSQVVLEKETFIKRSDILGLITKKTNIPVGDIGDGERTKLMNMEAFLHARVVGQDEAVKLVSNAMRRARAGVRNMKRPIGSFLFLGPTGVGKTETAKALAEAFFGNEDVISRFDMSEYQTADALERLIGYFEGEKVGALTKILKQKPFGVLLLDEFEKTNKEVLDLFLQVLDEGFFSDMRGKRVNARNVIIIATSNAGSDLIWEAGKSGADLSQMKDEIINKMIERGTFKPELLNRFDATVLFHPLGESELARIARLMLQKLARRLREKSLDLVITDDLVNAVIRHGTDPSFGARPMNRAIQEKVEQVIAEKLISGEIKEGAQVVIRPEEIL